MTEQSARAQMESLAQRYRTNPSDTANAMRYARALRATGQAPQAVAVLERVAIRETNNMALMGEFGGSRRCGPPRPGAASAAARPPPGPAGLAHLQCAGTIYDQLGRPQEAQVLYNDALKIAPGQPAILTNLGLSYALSRQLPQAEQVLRQAAAHPQADKRARQNLALVVGLQGRFSEAEEIARKDLPPAEAEENMTYLRSMVAQPNSWAQIRQSERRGQPGQRPAGQAAPAPSPAPRG